MTAAKIFERPPSGRATRYGCAGLLALFALMSYSAILQKSPTWDEPLHVAGGYLIRWFGDHCVDGEDPALFQWLTTIPQSRSDLSVRTNDPQLAAIYHDHNEQLRFAVDTLFRTPMPDSAATGGPAVYSGSAYINRSRAVFTCIGVLLGALTAWWSLRLAGRWAAIIACVLFAFDPNFLAHSSIVKNDVPMALLMLWLAFATWHFGRSANWRNFLGMELACALAVNIKFSGLLFPGMLALLLAARATLAEPWRVCGRVFATRVSRLYVALACFCCAILLGWGLIWATYGFRYSPSPNAALHIDREFLLQKTLLREMAQREFSHHEPMDPNPTLPKPSASVSLLLAADSLHLLPSAWSMGLLYTYQSTLTRGTFLMGKVSPLGQWYYFPCAMFFKTPLAVLALAAILPVIWLLRKSRAQHPTSDTGWTMLCLWLPIAVYGLSAMQSNLAIGLRHVLPLYPLIYVLMAVSLARWIGTGGRVAIVAACILLGGLVLESVHAWPDYIPFFNVACGGERGGLNLLGDSNLDWGQDLPLLAQWQEDHPDERLYLSYFGLADPAYYGVSYLNISSGYAYSPEPIVHMDKPGVLAISATNLQGIYYPEKLRDDLAGLRRRQPLAILGGSIYVYPWTDRDAALVQASESQVPR